MEQTLREQILLKLATVIDPETGIDVIRMRLIEDLEIDDDGVAHYVFRPSSPLCPLAVSLVLKIREAVAEIPGVTKQDITVAGYVGADELNALLREENGTA